MREEVDGERFPSLHAYLATLPHGLDSYPEALSKGSLVRSSLEGHAGELLRGGLPVALQALIDSPPPAGVWLPAVHSDAVFHAVCDRLYPSDVSVLDWCEARTTSMAKSPMYAAVFRMPGPAMLIRITARVHGLMQRGTHMDATLDGRHARVHMTFPPHLHSRLNLLSNVGMFRGVVRITGGHEPEARMIGFSPTEADFECSWS